MKYACVKYRAGESVQVLANKRQKNTRPEAGFFPR